MNRLLALIKVELTSTFQLKHFKYALKNKNNKITFIVLALALASLIPTYLFSFKTIDNLYQILYSLNQSSFIILIGILLVQVFVLFISLITMLSKLYYSKDLDLLLSFPLKVRDILIAKAISSLPLLYILTLILILPFYYTYFINNVITITLIFYAFILFILLPIFPLMFSALISIIFMKYTNIKKYQNIIRSILITIGTLLLVYVQYQIQIKLFDVLEDESKLIELITNANLFLETFKVYLPFSFYPTKMFINSDFISFIIYLLLSLIPTVLYVFSDQLYISSYLKNQNISSFKFRVNHKEDYKKQSVTISLIKKELIILFKTPIYLFNLLGGVIVLPIIGLSIIKPLENIDIISIINEVFTQDIIILAVSAFLAFFALAGNSAQTTFSREGRAMWINQSLPIKARDQILARTITSLLIQLITISVYIIALMYFIKLKLISALLILIISILSSTQINILSILIDLNKPYLTWETPQKAMKQNINVLISTGINLGILLIIGFISYFLLDYINIYLIYLIIITYYLLLSIILFKYTSQRLDKRLTLMN